MLRKVNRCFRFALAQSFIVFRFLVSLVIISIVTCLFWAGRRNTNIPSPNTKPAKEIESTYNQKCIDHAIELLRTGDIVLRTGSDVTSYMLTQMNQKEKSYSHCGIVIIEDGCPFVYHSIGGEDNPDQELKRDSVSFFFSPLNNLGFAVARTALSETQNISFIETVKLFYKQRRKFDLDFDLGTDDRLYCSEFVYKAMRQALKDSCFIERTRVFGKEYIGIDNLYLNDHTKLICQVKFK